MKFREQNSSPTTYGGYRLDAENAQLVHISGETKQLRSKSLAVFSVLANKRDKLVSKKELFQAVWPDSIVCANSLVQCITEIRRALCDQQRKILVTRPRQGYYLIPDSASEATDDAAATDSHTGDTETHIPTGLADPFESSPLIGRDGEMQLSTAWVCKQSLNSGGLLLISGVSGVGKTRLLKETCNVAQQNWLVCQSTCYEFGKRLAFFSLANWLRTPAVYERCKNRQSTVVRSGDHRLVELYDNPKIRTSVCGDFLLNYRC